MLRIKRQLIIFLALIFTLPLLFFNTNSVGAACPPDDFEATCVIQPQSAWPPSGCPAWEWTCPSGGSETCDAGFYACSRGCCPIGTYSYSQGSYYSYSQGYYYGYSQSSYPPTCTVSLAPATTSVTQGSTRTFTATVSNIQNGSVSSVNFSSGNTGIATVSPASDTSVVYNTVATGTGQGSTTIRADVIMSGSSRCNATSNITVTRPNPWWQTIDSDLFSTGNITSNIPGTCTGGCIPRLIRDGAGGYPGVAAFTGTLNTGLGTTSSTNWSANSGLSAGKTYSYAYFVRQIPSSVVMNEIASPSINGSELASGGTESNGYYYYHFDGAALGDLTITGNTTIVGDRKVVLLVEGGNLTLAGQVRISSPGQGFFMAVVGETSGGSKGNTFVSQTVGGTNDGVPEIEGIYVTDNQFNTGTAGAASDTQLHIRGSVAAYAGIN